MSLEEARQVIIAAALLAKQVGPQPTYTQATELEVAFFIVLATLTSALSDSLAILLGSPATALRLCLLHIHLGIEEGVNESMWLCTTAR